MRKGHWWRVGRGAGGTTQ